MMSTIAAIIERMEDINRHLEQLDVSVRVLRQEREDLATALRVMRRFGAEDEAGPVVEPSLEGRRVEPEEGAAPSGKRPPGTPPIPEMILEVLSYADVVDAGGLAPKHIVTAIRDKWWPGARAESVGSIAWRMSREGRLLKEDGRYRLPPEPSGELFARADSAAEGGRGAVNDLIG
jgi:hypothetical protein